MAESLRFYFDQHIQGAVALGLRLRGIDVLTAQEAGRCGLTDADQLQFATTEERAVMTYDPDYLALAAAGVAHAGIAYCHATKYAIGQLIDLLALLHGVMDRDSMKNQIEYL